MVAVERSALPRGPIEFATREWSRTFNNETVTLETELEPGPSPNYEVATRCELPSCPVLEVPESDVRGVTVGDALHGWIRRISPERVSVVAVEQKPSWTFAHEPGFSIAVVPTVHGYSTWPSDRKPAFYWWPHRYDYDLDGNWYSGQRVAPSLDKYAYEWVNRNHIRLLKRISGSWNDKPSAGVIVGDAPNKPLCNDCVSELWKCPVVPLRDASGVGGWFRTEANLMYGGGHSAELNVGPTDCFQYPAECVSFPVLDASPALRDEPRSGSSGEIVARRCGQGVCNVTLIAAIASGERLVPVLFDAALGATGAVTTDGQNLVGGYIRLGVPYWRSVRKDPWIGDMAGLALHLRILKPLPQADNVPSKSAWFWPSLQPWFATREDYTHSIIGDQWSRHPSLLGLLVPELGLLWRDPNPALSLGWSLPIRFRLGGPYYVIGRDYVRFDRARIHPYRIDEHLLLEFTPSYDLTFAPTNSSWNSVFGLSIGLAVW